MEEVRKWWQGVEVVAEEEGVQGEEVVEEEEEAQQEEEDKQKYPEVVRRRTGDVEVRGER